MLCLSACIPNNLQKEYSVLRKWEFLSFCLRLGCCCRCCVCLLSITFHLVPQTKQKERLVIGQTNQLTGTIPTELSQCTNLKELKLSHIPFSNDKNGNNNSLPTSFAQLSNLEQLNLRSSNLVGTLPVEYGSSSMLTNLKLFDASYNPSITGTIPTEYGLLKNLSTFVISFWPFVHCFVFSPLHRCHVFVQPPKLFSF